MHLRKLRLEDAPLMLEWMHDPSVTEHMKTRFGEMTLEDCEHFIRASQVDGRDVHFAIADDADDTYLGTVSLKHLTNASAEFAITVRKRAMGTGASRQAMAAIIEYGFKQLGLERVYWCVSPENTRAVRFYDKQGHPRSGVPTEAQGYTPEEMQSFIWYTVLRPEGER